MRAMKITLCFLASLLAAVAVVKGLPSTNNPDGSMAAWTQTGWPPGPTMSPYAADATALEKDHGHHHHDDDGHHHDDDGHHHDDDGHHHDGDD
ncbi:hypothetical protein BGZ83_011271 [Gryganskiella cystojenkinii]|nr:hypothetical protein BGZ83_011271 [Gryganskiella cystojenkinii]